MCNPYLNLDYPTVIDMSMITIIYSLMLIRRQKCLLPNTSPYLDGILQKWLQQNKVHNVEKDTIKSRPRDVLIPVSSSQKRLWLLQHMYPENPFYHCYILIVINVSIKCINKIVFFEKKLISEDFKHVRYPKSFSRYFVGTVLENTDY